MRTGRWALDDLDERVARSLVETLEDVKGRGRQPHPAVSTMLSRDPETMLADGKSGAVLQHAKRLVSRADSRLEEVIREFIPITDMGAGWLQEALESESYAAAAKAAELLALASEYDVNLLGRIATILMQGFDDPILGTAFGQRWRYLAIQTAIAICVSTERWDALAVLLGLPASADTADAAPFAINSSCSYPPGYQSHADRAAGDLLRSPERGSPEMIRVWGATLQAGFPTSRLPTWPSASPDASGRSTSWARYQPISASSQPSRSGGLPPIRGLPGSSVGNADAAAALGGIGPGRGEGDHGGRLEASPVKRGQTGPFRAPSSWDDLVGR